MGSTKARVTVVPLQLLPYLSRNLALKGAPLWPYLLDPHLSGRIFWIFGNGPAPLLNQRRGESLACNWTPSMFHRNVEKSGATFPAAKAILLTHHLPAPGFSSMERKAFLGTTTFAPGHKVPCGGYERILKKGEDRLT